MLIGNYFLKSIRLGFLYTLLGLSQQSVAIDAGMPNPPASPTVVKVGVFLAEIIDLDEVDETFEAEIVIDAEWMSPRLAFDQRYRSAQSPALYHLPVSLFYAACVK